MMRLIQGDVRTLPLADNSVDMIFTDPPYAQKYLPCYRWLAAEAMRVLKPGGFVLAMCGSMYINQIYRIFDDSGLTYHYEMVHIANGEYAVIWPRNVWAQAKPILAYSKGRSSPQFRVVNAFNSSGKDKRYHHWGQPVGHACYYIGAFSAKGETVLDPFIGGGTTATACELIGRRCIGMDIDMRALDIARRRLAGAGIQKQQALWEQP